MRIGPVDWGAYPGELLELAMAVLIAQDHPETIRRVPQSGDGGIDLMVPDGPAVEVLQVKRFTGRLGKGERQQIKKSWQTFRKDPRLSRPVCGYHLVMPVDATPDEQKWFDELTADAPWPATWRGAAFWHSLAAKHPHVIDYVFGGGRDRVAQRSRALQTAVIDPSVPLTAMDAAGSLNTMLVALNRDDPHYRYDLATSVDPPAAVPGSVLQHTQALSDGGYLAISVTPKHRYALTDSPIQGQLTIEIADRAIAAQFRDAFEAFEYFGRALDLPEGMVSMVMQAPGGLGGSFEGGGGWIGPALVDAKLPDLRLVAVSPTDDEIGSLNLRLDSATRGQAGGAELHLSDDSGLVKGIITLGPLGNDEQATSFTFELRDFDGAPVQQVLEVLEVMGSLGSPNHVELRYRYTAGTFARAEEIAVGSFLTDGGRRHLEDLATLQQLTQRPILVPDEIDPKFATELREYARMLRGETLTGTWDELTAHLNADRPEVTALEGEHSFLIDRPITMVLDDQEVEMGRFLTHFNSGRLADEQPDDLRLATLVPGPDPAFSQRAAKPLV